MRPAAWHSGHGGVLAQSTIIYRMAVGLYLGAELGESSLLGP